MKTRTNQPVFLDNGENVDDSKLGGTKLYRHSVFIQDNENEIHLNIISALSSSIVSTDMNTTDYISIPNASEDAEGRGLIVASFVKKNNGIYLASYDVINEKVFNWSTIDISSLIAFTDTVTPL